ncbi:hypothetical protein Pint_20562 [Pistacia integerrima]|uniref:Uncharacterized protein n=1 Tax=Pistacia integerrima TaxID=434235 RepID=A0ACC0X804_9ROSI|nr:hypothetical protein Pint_20562 [Pistacia integerrima]
MAAPVPPGAPRQRPPPQSNYNPNFQQNPNALFDNFQNLNINRPVSMPNSTPRPTPFAQTPPFPSTTPQPPMSRPGPPPPGVVPRSMGTQQPTLPPNVAQRPPAPPAGQSFPFGGRPPPGSFPSSLGSGGPVGVPPSGVPPAGALPSSGSLAGPFAPPPSARPFASSSTLSSGMNVPPSSAQDGLTSNGPLSYAASGAAPGGPRFPPPGSAMQTQTPPVGHPSMVASVRSPPQSPSMRFPLGSAGSSSSMVPPMQQAMPFSAPPQSAPPFSSAPPISAAPPQGVPPPQGSPFGPQTWQSRQVGPSHPIPGSVQPPRMFGMPPPLPTQSMTTIPPAMGQTGAPVAASSKIDPQQIPRPIPSSMVVMYDTREGNQSNTPPPATSDYIVRDTGNCSPRYMRCTISQIPCTNDLLATSGMQLALLVQPLALPHPSEEAIQVVDFGESGPVRCSRCKAYINPFMRFIDQGRRFICNLCGFTDETPRDYHCNLGPDGRRRDADERPELCRGTVEFIATKEYMVRDPMPAVYFFLIDVSMNAIQTGATAAACGAISQVIADLPEGPRTMVGIATFDCTIHFYNLKRALQQPLMLIVPDIEDVYTPLESDVIVPLSECRQHLEMLLESIPSMFLNNRTAESAFGAAVKASFLAMKSTGGKLLVFQSGKLICSFMILPSVGIGALSAREAEGRSNISAGEKESHKLLQPADKTLKAMAMEFAEYQVCVDVFLTTQTYVDIASISVIPRITGGQVYYYYPFSALSDPAKLYNDLRWNITRPQGFEAVMRVRCSQGIQVQDYYGNFCKRIPTDIDLPAIDCNKAIMVTLKHDDKLQDGSECAFQELTIILFLSLTTLFVAANEIPSTPLVNVREQMMNLCVNALVSYRKFCATVSSSGQLILPEALKLLPLYTLALIKSAGLRNDGRIDDRSFWITYVSSVSIPLAVPFVYPRMVAIHDLDSKVEGGSPIPPFLPLSSEHVSDEGIYLLENGEDALIYIGSSVESNILRQLLGINSVEEIPTQVIPS